MSRKIFATIALLVFSLTVLPVSGQRLVCRKPGLAAVRPIPKLEYECNEDLTESADEVLTQPERLEALKDFRNELEKLDDAAWWSTSTEELDFCAFLGKTGSRRGDDDEFLFSEPNYELRGNNRYRLVVAKDPCYQVGFGGSNIFLLNRVGPKVYATEVIDGFYTRADFPLEFDYAVENGETIVEIATLSGGLSSTDRNYYFSIDPKTHRAVPKKMFRVDGKLTHIIESETVLDDPADYGLPPKAQTLEIIKNHRLTKSFYLAGLRDTEGSKRKGRYFAPQMRWNGRFYQ
ncbi:MAG: hypothetical protein JSS81_20195 [Acidobacteria bacterium]|nr:hypothetical protein [Acidobacteriota bacterium]